MSDCLFCKIIEGKIPSTKVYEDDRVLAFKDIRPQSPIHYLFIPKEHFKSLADLPGEKIGVLADIFAAIKKVADQEGVSDNGYRTVINTRQDGCQTVDHLHVHLIGGRQLGGNMAGV
jgi:histidine triad (HIT) family protein